jgi:hypothetical protein
MDIDLEATCVPAVRRLLSFRGCICHFASAYGGGNSKYMLVWPDGYLGWVGLEENLPDLDRYLAAVLR